MDTNTKKLHPLLLLAAVSLTVFSAVGIAALTGLIPHSKGSVSADAPPLTVQAPVVAQAEPAPAPSNPAVGRKLLVNSSNAFTSVGFR